MASLNGFSVKVPECLEETSKNYVLMKHGQQYTLQLSNRHKDNGRGKPCDVEVYIDDEFCGSYRIESGQTFFLERPEYSSKKFTAYRKDSREAQEAEIDTESDSLGLIRVVFRPGTNNSNNVVVNDWSYTPKESEPFIKESEPFVPTKFPMPGVYAYAVIDWDSISYPVTRSSFTCEATNNPCNCNSSRGIIGGGTGLSGISNQKFNEIDALNYDEPSTTIYLRLAFEDKEREIRPLRRVYETRIPKRI